MVRMAVRKSRICLLIDDLSESCTGGIHVSSAGANLDLPLAVARSRVICARRQRTGTGQPCP